MAYTYPDEDKDVKEIDVIQFLKEDGNLDFDAVHRLSKSLPMTHWRT